MEFRIYDQPGALHSSCAAAIAEMDKSGGVFSLRQGSAGWMASPEMGMPAVTSFALLLVCLGAISIPFRSEMMGNRAPPGLTHGAARSKGACPTQSMMTS